MRIKKSSWFFSFFLSALLATISPPQETLGADLFVNPDFFGVCSRADPCKPHTALIMAVPGDTIYFKYGTYKGEPLATQVIQVTKEITLRGGWDGSATGDLICNPEANPTLLDGEDSRRVVRISGSTSDNPVISGFTIINGNATGLINNCSGSGAQGCGGGIFVSQAGARILNNKILNNKALAPNGIGYGGGIHLEGTVGAIIRGNLFEGNQAQTSNFVGGGGLSILGSTTYNTSIIHNQFIKNRGFFGSAVWAEDQESLFISDNFLEKNEGPSVLFVSGVSTISRNRFQNHQNSTAVSLGSYGGTFDGNILIDNKIGISITGGALPAPRLSNNIIKTSESQAIIAQGIGPNPLNMNLEHNTLVGAGTGAAISIPGNQYVALSMTNNIISGFSTGVENLGYPSATVTACNTLFDLNIATPGMNVYFHNSLTGNPAFIDPGTHDYHIQIYSAAKDAGSLDFLAVKDIDGDPRPIGSAPDIGADEYQPLMLYLPLINK
jgi:hypothetical protein